MNCKTCYKPVNVTVRGNCDACEVIRLESENSALRQEITVAMRVLDPNMPESGIEDAARQVKQVAVTATENNEAYERKVRTLAITNTALRQGMEKLRSALIEHKDALGECLDVIHGEIAKDHERLDAFQLVLEEAIPLPGEKSEMRERLEEAEKVIDEYANEHNWSGPTQVFRSECLNRVWYQRSLAESYRMKYPEGK